MDLTRDTHTIVVDGHEVKVTGETGPVQARWALWIDDTQADRAETAGGDLTLRAAIGATEVEAHVRQSMFGPTKVTFLRDGEAIESRSGFVA
jgi:hypothetical protein